MIVEVAGGMLCARMPMPAIVANVPTSAIPTREPDFVFSIIAHDAGALPTRDHSPRRTNPGRLFTCAEKVAELTSQQDGTMRQQLIEHLTREIMNSDAEFRSEEATASSGSIARH
jgi:hypothetical protein